MNIGGFSKDKRQPMFDAEYDLVIYIDKFFSVDGKLEELDTSISKRLKKSTYELPDELINEKHTNLLVDAINAIRKKRDGLIEEIIGYFGENLPKEEAE